MVAAVAVVVLGGCGGDSDDGADDGTTASVPTETNAPESDEPGTDEPGEESSETGAETSVPLSDDLLAEADFAKAMLSGDEIASYFEATASYPLEEQEPFDLAGEGAHFPCNYPPEGVTVVAGTGLEHVNDGSVSVTQYLGGYNAEAIEESWSKLREAADLDGYCKDFEDDGEINRVDGTEPIRAMFQANHGLDVTEDENLLVTEFETPKGTKILDVVVRRGQIVGQFRVVHTSVATDAEAVAAGAAFVEHLRENENLGG